MSRFLLLVSAGLILALAPGTARGQFLDHFDGEAMARDPDGLEGWSYFTGAGDATISLERTGPSQATIRVDAPRDRNVWWALVRRAVSKPLDLESLARPDRELRVEARIRVGAAPRRVNLHLTTQRTTDFHSHLMEFDIPDTLRWHTISMTTRGFDAGPGDTVYAQLALMDWGAGEHRVDLDYVKVDVVEPGTVPDRGEAVSYHPPVPDPTSFRRTLPVAHDATIDVAHPTVSLGDWVAGEGARRTRVLAVNGTQYTLLRFDPGGLRAIDHAGVLELTTYSVQRPGRAMADFGLVRVTEILAGDPEWDQETVTARTFLQDRPVDAVLNPQMIMDAAVRPGDGAKTRLTIPRPVLRRLADGRTRGLAIRPLGSIAAAFYDSQHGDGSLAPRLLLDPAPPAPVSDTVVESSLETIDIESGSRRVVYRTRGLIEAPNWAPDGSYLLFNGGGRIYTIPVTGGEPTLLDTGFATRVNNDHGISPDGSTLAISDQSRDGQSRIYVLPISGGTPRPVTPRAPSYWHGWSPDGRTLAYVAERDGDFDIYTIPVDGGEEARLTTAPGLDDGPDYTPDGSLIYFNSVRTGTMQIWRMEPDGSRQEQVTFDPLNDWFPHPSPDGRWVAFLSYQPDVQGHPANRDVMLRIIPADGGEPRILTRLFGGQGTINVPSWSPDSRSVAFVSYRLVPDSSPEGQDD